VLFELRVIAGITRQEYGVSDGSLSVGVERRSKRQELARSLARTIHDLSPARVVKALDDLKCAGFVKISRSDVVTLAGWRKEQEGAPSEEAAKKRRQRERKAVLSVLGAVADERGTYHKLDALVSRVAIVLGKRRTLVSQLCDLCTRHGYLVDVDGETVCIANYEWPYRQGALPPVPPASDSGFDSGCSGGDMSPPNGGTCPPYERNETEDRKTYVFPNSDSGETPTATGAGGTGGKAHANCGLSKDDVWRLPPLNAVELLVGEPGKWSENGFTKKLRMLKTKHGEQRGTQIFRQCMEAIMDSIAEGYQYRSRAAALHKKLNKWVEA